MADRAKLQRSTPRLKRDASTIIIPPPRSKAPAWPSPLYPSCIPRQMKSGGLPRWMTFQPWRARCSPPADWTWGTPRPSVGLFTVLSRPRPYFRPLGLCRRCESPTSPPRVLVFRSGRDLAGPISFAIARCARRSRPLLTSTNTPRSPAPASAPISRRTRIGRRSSTTGPSRS